MKDSAVDPKIRNFVRTQTDIAIDRYSGKGGFGELYFGTRNIIGDRVALKFYQFDEDEGHEEAVLLKQIEHENILKLLDARFLDDNIAYYLTPEISGGDLQNILDNYILPTEKAIYIVQGILKALIELHKPPLNLVHRDLKTYNILVDEDTGKAYLADFGTIKKIPDGVEYVAASKYTFLYRAPEVVVERKYGKQSDIYQIGIILYQVLGGSFPLKAPEKWLQGRHLKKYNQLPSFEQRIFLQNHIEDLIKKGKILDLDSLPIFISKKLKTIIKTAICPDVRRRFSSCADFLKALFDYQKIAKGWWIEDGTIFCHDKKKGRLYRIVNRTRELVTECKHNGGDWRKIFSNSELINHIQHIEKK